MILRWWKQRSTHGIVGLDISPTSIKLLEINSSEIPFQIKSFAMVAMPSGAFVKGEVKDLQLIADTLSHLFNQSNIQTKSVALATSRSSVVIKNIAVDNRLNVKEIESRAWIEANHQFPDLVGEIYLDFTVNPSLQDPNQLELMLVACRKDQIIPYLEILKNAGLVAKVIDVNSFALERSLVLMVEPTPELQTVALLNLDNHLSSLLVLHDKSVIYAHDHSYDGNRLQSQTQTYLDTAIEKIATLNDAAYVEILKSVMSAHLRHTMHFFYSSRPHISIQKLILSGDCANTPCLAEFIQQEVGIETVIANPVATMTVLPGIDEKLLQANAPGLVLACGLALSSDQPINVSHGR